MAKMTKLTTTAFLFSSLAAVGVACVTVNVNFPESAVQKATDDYVRDLYRARERGRANGGPAPSSSTAPSATPVPRQAPGADGRIDDANAPESDSASTLRRLRHLTFPELLLPIAHADTTIDFKVNSDKAMQIRDKLAALLDDMLDQKRSGTLGETNDGFVSLRGAGSLKPLLQKKVQKLADDENGLRRSLYDEVLSSNGISKGRLKEIQRSFARSFQAESPSGTWVQDSDGGWARKP